MPKPPPPPEEIASLMRFIAEKVKNVKSPMSIRQLARQFKEETGTRMTVDALKERVRRNRHKIHEMTEFDRETKVKMMFAIGAPIHAKLLKKLQNDAIVELDGNQRIKKYKSKDGSLELEESHGLSTSIKSVYSDRWHTVCEKANENESEKDDGDDTNGQKDYAKKRIEVVRFLIERTKNVSSSLSIKQLAKDYKKEFKSSEPLYSTITRITRFRQYIYKIDQFDTSAKVKMLFALSAPINADFLKELQKDAIVEMDEQLRIKKYKSNDGSLNLEGDHSMSAKIKAGRAENKKTKVLNESSESEDDGDEEDRSEFDGSEEKVDGENVGESARSKQTPTSSSVRRNYRLQESRVSLQNKNKKRHLSEKNSDFTHTRNHARMSRGKKRARISYSSSEASEDDPSAKEDDDEESEKSEDDSSMINEDNNVDNFGDDFDYDPPINNNYDEDLEHNVTDPNLERNIQPPDVRDDVEEKEEKKEETSACSSAKIESMSLLELLNHLRSSIVQYTPNLVHKIDEKVKNLESEDQQISFQLIIESLEMCIEILNTPDEMDSDKNTTSLCDFFYRLERATCNITHSMMSDFHIKIEKLAWAKDTKVSLEHIRYAMGKTLDKILH